MAFKLHGSLNPHGGPVLRREIIASSVTITELDAVKFDTDGFVALATTGDALLGHVIGISDNNGVGLSTDGTSGAAMGSYTNTFTTSSTNETVAKVRAEVDLSQLTLYSAEASATLGTTSGSSEAGVYFDLTDEDTIDESSVTDSTAQYHSWGPDPNDSARLVVNIFESSVFSSA